jgi:hypothetical protein
VRDNTLPVLHLDCSFELRRSPPRKSRHGYCLRVYRTRTFSSAFRIPNIAATLRRASWATPMSSIAMVCGCSPDSRMIVLTTFATSLQMCPPLTPVAGQNVALVPRHGSGAPAGAVELIIGTAQGNRLSKLERAAALAAIYKLTADHSILYFWNKPLLGYTSKSPPRAALLAPLPSLALLRALLRAGCSGRERALWSGAARPPPLRLGLIREGAKRLERSGACGEA